MSVNRPHPSIITDTHFSIPAYKRVIHGIHVLGKPSGELINDAESSAIETPLWLELELRDRIRRLVNMKFPDDLALLDNLGINDIVDFLEGRFNLHAGSIPPKGDEGSRGADSERDILCAASRRVMGICNKVLNDEQKIAAQPTILRDLQCEIESQYYHFMRTYTLLAWRDSAILPSDLSDKTTMIIGKEEYRACCYMRVVSLARILNNRRVLEDWPYGYEAQMRMHIEVLGIDGFRNALAPCLHCDDLTLKTVAAYAILHNDRRGMFDTEKFPNSVKGIVLGEASNIWEDVPIERRREILRAYYNR